MRRTKILAIAPYEGLREILLDESISRTDVDMDVYFGDLADGVAVALALENAGYDVILSRGGTATMISTAVQLPVIDMPPSASDLLRYVRMAENIPGRFAVVGFHSITNTANQLLALVNKSIRVITLEQQSDAEEAVKQLMLEGYTLLVGDAIAVATAKKYRMNSIMVASGKESVQNALSEAVRMNQLMRSTQALNILYKKILEHSELSVVVYDAEKHLLFSNLSQDHLEYQRVFRPLPEYVPTVLRDGDFRLIRRSKGYDFDVNGRIIRQESGDCVVFFIKQRMIQYRLKAGVVEYYHLLDANQENRLPIDNIGTMTGVLESARAYGRTHSTIVLSGEKGVAFDTVISAIHHESSISSSPLVMVDCSLLDERSFLWLMESTDSPLYETNLTVCLREFSSLGLSLRERFIRHTTCAFLTLRNRFIFCVDASMQYDEIPLKSFSVLNSCMLFLPPLRERMQDVPGLASLYLSSLNVEHGRQVLGFEERASQLLTSYDWPGNNDQLYRFVRQCLLRAETSAITASSVLDGIANERKVVLASAPSTMPLTGSLHEINKSIIQAVLKEEKMNKQKTAERLGISRSTLWRMLKGTGISTQT